MAMAAGVQPTATISSTANTSPLAVASSAAIDPAPGGKFVSENIILNSVKYFFFLNCLFH